MEEENSIEELFNELLEDKTEKKIMKMIIDDNESDEIIDALMGEGSK